MKYPTTYNYIETILNPDSLFRTLNELRAITDDHGNPIFRCGNFGTVFKVKIGDRAYALKCFTRAQNGRMTAYKKIAQALPRSQYVVDYNFIEDEMYVFDDTTTGGRYYSILLMEWVEGQTLTRALEEAVLAQNRPLLGEYLTKFEQMSEWLLGEDFAHNDLKPDNIMVREKDKSLVLIDYDGLFVPTMAGEPPREWGTEPYQSPHRRTAPFDKNVDNYAIAYIRLAISILSHNPRRYSAEKLVDFTDTELTDIEKNETFFGNRYTFVDNARDGVMITRADRKYGFVTSQGVTVAENCYDDIRPYCEGLAAVCAGGKWGFIDKDSKVVIAMVYDGVTDFDSGFCGVRIGCRWAFINPNGETLSRFHYDECFTPRLGLALAKRRGKYGFVGSDGRVAVSFRYDYAHSFTREGVACVKVGEKYGYIDRRSKWWQKPTYDFATPFRDGKARVEIGEREQVIEWE